jgi:predicted nucleic-acid-binding Zn-ribbon protein
MSNWQGFDPRKVCPNCGDYQTRVHKSEKKPISPGSAAALLITLGVLFAATGILVLVFIRQILLGQPSRPGLIFPFLLLFGNYLLNKKLKNGVKECWEIIIEHVTTTGKDRHQKVKSSDNTWIGYHLYCSHCGYTWEKSMDAWEKEEQEEVATL